MSDFPKHLFGIEGEPLEVDLPEGVIKYRVRQRNSSYAQVFLLYSDRIEHWFLMMREDGICFPAGLIGRNQRK